MTALKAGGSLAELLGRHRAGAASRAGLRRVTRAGSRNRSRILMLASEALGAPMIDSVPDQSSCGRYRAAVTAVDVGVNVLRKVEERKESKQFQYSTGVDATVSQGLLAMSNLCRRRGALPERERRRAPDRCATRRTRRCRSARRAS